MSRIGKKPILLPKEVEFNVSNSLVLVKGPKGELKKEINPAIKVSVEGDSICLRPVSGSNAKEVSPLWGLYRSLLKNMVKGVSVGFEKSLTFQGVGFRAVVKGSDLELSLGFTNPVVVKGPAGISFKVEKNKITVFGIDKELVGQVAAEIRKQRKPEPYHGSGIKYENEVIIKKAGKKAATATT